MNLVRKILSLSPRAVLYHHRILSEALSHAVKMGLLVRNVAKVVDPPRPKRRNMATLAAEDVARFLQASQETPYYVLFCTALFTGMRLGELLALRWSDVDLDVSSLSIVRALYKRCGVCRMIEPKSSHSWGSIALSPVLASLLRRHKAQREAERILLEKPVNEGDLVFAHPDGSPLDLVQSLIPLLKSLGKRACLIYVSTISDIFMRPLC